MQPPSYHVPLINAANYSSRALPGVPGSASSARTNAGDIAILQQVENYITVEQAPLTLSIACKKLWKRSVCAFETSVWHLLDGVNWGAYLGGGAIATAACMVGLMALPVILKSAITGIMIMTCEAVGEAVLRYYATEEFPSDRLPVLLDRFSIENLPVLGDFLSFKWLRNLPFQGERYDENQLTYFGSRMVVGGVYGGFMGFFTALASLAPQSILATGAVFVAVGFMVRALGCIRVIPDFVFLSDHEMNESRLYHKDACTNRSIRDRLTGNTESSQYIPRPPAENVDRALEALMLRHPRETVSQDDVNRATTLRCYDAHISNRFTEESLEREFSFYLQANRTIAQSIKQRDLRLAKEQTRQLEVERRQQEQDQIDRMRLGLPNGDLTPDMIDRGYRWAAEEHDRHRGTNINDIAWSAARLRARYPGDSLGA